MAVRDDVVFRIGPLPSSSAAAWSAHARRELAAVLAGGETCPLVLRGQCPVGDPDIVVCALHDEWRPSVEAAWRVRNTPVVAVDEPLAWPAHLGAAFAWPFTTAEGAGDDAR